MPRVKHRVAGIRAPNAAMSTWIEIAAAVRGTAGPGSATHGQPRAAPDTAARDAAMFDTARAARTFHERSGMGPHSFPQRLSRARMLFLRRHEMRANWLALSLVTVGLLLPQLHAGHSLNCIFGCEASPRGNSIWVTRNRIQGVKSIEV